MENFDLRKYLAEGRLLKESAGYVYASCDREALSIWTQEEFDTYVEDIAEGDGTSKEEALEYLKDEQMLTKLPNSPYLLVYADDESLDFISANTKEEFVNEVNDNSFDGQLEGEVDAMFAEICSIADDSSIDGDSAAQQIVIENGKIVGGDNSKAW